MDYFYADDAITLICEHFVNDDFPSLNMSEDDWNDVLEETFNSIDRIFEYKDYSCVYDDILVQIHNKAEDLGIEPQYWNFQKMMNLYFYIIAKEIIADCKEEIIEKWRDMNESESESESESDDESDVIQLFLDTLVPLIHTQVIPLSIEPSQ